MPELKIDISEGLKNIMDKELDSSEIKLLLASAVEEKLRLLLLFKTVNKVLSKSRLSEDKFSELTSTFRGRLAKRYGVS